MRSAPWRGCDWRCPSRSRLRHSAEVCCGGTLLAARHALADGVGLHLGGGFHHAFADHGEGFCLLNDVAVAVTHLLDRERWTRALVVDLDVHQGNGTAAIFAAEERVFTFSMHQEENYPFVKPPSDLDIGLSDGTADARYLAVLEANLPRVLARYRPQLVVFLAGADPYREDELGGLALSVDGLRRRDVYVLETACAAGAGVAVTLAGGYAFRLSDTVEIHAATLEGGRRAGSLVPGGGIRRNVEPCPRVGVEWLEPGRPPKGRPGCAPTPGRDPPSTPEPHEPPPRPRRRARGDAADLLRPGVTLLLLFGVTWLSFQGALSNLENGRLAVLVGFVLLAASLSGSDRGRGGTAPHHGLHPRGDPERTRRCWAFSPTDAVEELRLIDRFALALIAMLAGGELQLDAAAAPGPHHRRAARW